ncbi:MAG: N-acetyltransferase [Ferrimonas sp.]
MQIRFEHPSDIDAIRSLTYQAFDGHPHHAAGAKPSEHLLIDRLRSAGVLSLSLVAEQAETIVGHIAFSPITMTTSSGQSITDWYGLAPVSVLPEQQNKGIGAALIKEGLARLAGLQAQGVVVLGEPHYYHHFGFSSDPKLHLAGVPPQYFMYHLLADTQPLPQGEVHYHPAFFE